MRRFLSGIREKYQRNRELERERERVKYQRDRELRDKITSICRSSRDRGTAKEKYNGIGP